MDDVAKFIIEEFAKAKALEHQALSIREQAEALFRAVAAANGIDKVSSSAGTVFMKQTGLRKILDQNKAKDNLLKAGVNAAIVAEAFEKATSIRPSSDIVVFRAAKEG